MALLEGHSTTRPATSRPAPSRPATSRPATSTTEPTRAAPTRSTSRDGAVDLVRAACLVVVVGLHAMMAGVTIGSSGPTINNALEGHPIFALATWVVQVMPLFFILGGFSSLSQWRRWTGTRGEYIRSRVVRLARPAVLFAVVVGGIVWLSSVLGADARLIDEISFRVGQPLWFLAVYLGCCALVPIMARLHEVAPKLTVLGLLAGAVTIDLAASTNPAIGYVNFFFVWLFVQQLGFWLADGWFDRYSRRQLVAAGAAAFAGMLVLVFALGYSADMFVNLNPPTLAILLLGVAQVFLFAAVRARLRAQAARPLVSRVAANLNRHSMTIYLWHLPAIVMVGLWMLVVDVVPEPLGVQWWATRPLWLACVGLAVVPIVFAVARFDRTRPRIDGTPSTSRATVSTVLAIAGVAVLLIAGFAPVWNAALGVTLLLAGLGLLTRTRWRIAQGQSVTRGRWILGFSRIV